MLIRNLLFTIRNFKNQKLFAIVNLAGLTTGSMQDNPVKFSATITGLIIPI
jgi:hypothetical protein